MPKSPPRTHARYIGVLERNRWSDSRIALHFGKNKKSVYEARVRRKLPPVPFPLISPLRKERIIFLRRHGSSFEEIARKTDMETAAVKRFLKSQQVKANPSSPAEKKRIRFLYTRGMSPILISRGTGHPLTIVKEIIASQLKRRKKK